MSWSRWERPLSAWQLPCHKHIRALHPQLCLHLATTPTKCRGQSRQQFLTAFTATEVLKNGLRSYSSNLS